MQPCKHLFDINGLDFWKRETEESTRSIAQKKAFFSKSMLAACLGNIVFFRWQEPENCSNEKRSHPPTQEHNEHNL